MRALFVTSEFHPLVKTGGLADVSAALPAALTERGVDIRVLLPGYTEALDRAVHFGRSISLGDVPGAGPARLLPAQSPDSGLPLWLVDCPPLYCRTGGPYQDEEGGDWRDNDERFAALSRVAAMLSRGEVGLEWRPDVVHANDWHAGLVPLLLRDRSAPYPATVFTIHNLAFQGLFDADRLPHIGLSVESFNSNEIEFYGRISFLKAGIRHADRLTTVSRTYAQEIQTPEFGCGLDGLLRQRAEHLIGIQNGADYGIWDPKHDLDLPRQYGVAKLGGKRACKEALQQELGLPAEPDAPVVAFLSRLTEQKMADTVADAVPWLVESGAQFALHAEGDRVLQDRFLALARRHPGRISVRIGYEEKCARRLLAGADILLHPSRFEPFGLVPIYALRYGALPVVRRVGGLTDSIVDGGTDGAGEATGFVFSGLDLDDLVNCLERAIGVFRQPVAWRRMQFRAMSQDFGWQGPAQKYLELYRTVAEVRNDPPLSDAHSGSAPWSDCSLDEPLEPLQARSMKG